MSQGEGEESQSPQAAGANRQWNGCRIGVIGAGNFASRVLIPAFAKAGAELATVVSEGGVSAAQVARKSGFARAATDSEAIFADDDIDAVVIATRHDSHADLTLRALEAGKHVFVEKPLCLSAADLEKIEAAQARSGRLVMVGFNRRFSPHTVAIRAALAPRRGPIALVMTVNAGSVPGDHWTRDPEAGGGRIVGEACHFVDLLRGLAGAPIVGHSISRLGADADCATLQLEFGGGSIGTIHYLTNGHRSFPKERLEVFANGRIFTIENFRRTRATGARGFRTVRTLRQDKGHTDCVRAFVQAIRSAEVDGPMPFSEIAEVMRTVLELAGTDAAPSADPTELPPPRGMDRRVIDSDPDIGLPS